MNKEATTPTIFYATNNSGKVMEVSRFLVGQGIKVITPATLNIQLDVAETGQTLAENVFLKATAYLSTPAGKYPILADDTGVEIVALGGEPGIHVRRWRGHRMTDQAIIEYCLERMKNIPKDKRQAKFRTALAFSPTSDQPVEYFYGHLDGEIIENPAPLRHPGLPFEVLFYVTEYQKMLYQLHDEPVETRTWLSHRERALTSALRRLKQVFGME